MKNIDNTLYVHWSKHENDLMIDYPTVSGKYLGLAIAELIEAKIKQYATDYDITSVKVQIKLKKECGKK